MLAFHGIFTAYGFWLSNDPRGSWSEFVASWELYRAGGQATKVDTTRSVAARPHDKAMRVAVKQELKHQPVVFTGLQARTVGRGFARAVSRSGHQLLACSILPDHVHVVVVAARLKSKAVLGHLKREGSLALKVDSLHPYQKEFASTGILPTCWARGCWKVFLDTEEAVQRAVRYVEENPMKEGKPRQRWSFIVPFAPIPRHRDGVG
jgi:REP element-mobilizing transposase RayT